MANSVKVPVSSSEWSVQDLPAGLSFTNGVLTGTPTASIGKYTAKVSVQTPWGRTAKSIPITIKKPFQFGVKIKKDESDPEGRVEYLYDAVGMKPVQMDFATGVFDFGDWEDIDFITDNKPLMLKPNGLVDYYLDPNDYTKKADGTASDIANTTYDGNAMAQFPRLYIKRYEDEEYEYEIVSNRQVDETYKAYAHTRADGSIAEYFYWSMFGGSGSASKIRSLSGQGLSRPLLNAPP